jgi:putative acetyltransferase
MVESGVEIKPIQPDQAEEAKLIVVQGCQEIWHLPGSPDEVLRQWNEIGVLSDMDDVQLSYFNSGGTFLVLTDAGRVVGTGAMRRLSDEICELKRMWFLKEYRGRGLGMRMAQMLLTFAREAGYKKVRLDTGDATKQPEALRLYERLGFYVIERYNDGPCTIFMEKSLD